MADEASNVVRTPIFPIYAEVKRLMAIWRDTVTKAAVLKLINAVWDQTGTPQNPVDWTVPDDWIAERLAGEDRALAKRIWEESHKTINPRHLYGSYLFINTHKLLVPDAKDTYRVTQHGELFLNDDPATVRKIDELEGIPKLLSILQIHSPAKRGDLIQDWGEYLHAHSKYGTTSTINSTLRMRIMNLIDRGFVGRKGNVYTINEKGVAYASAGAEDEVKPAFAHLVGSIKKFNEVQEDALRKHLGEMDPYRFEGLVKDLLEAMDYENVKVTKQSGDKGVDVVADFEFGITQVREVVQVKRHAGSITRPVLDQLRGALPYHQAIRGTIITLGTFARGCKDAALYPGAAPITLIDGVKLIELMIKHDIGMKKRPHVIYEVDLDYLNPAEITSPTGESAPGRGEA